MKNRKIRNLLILIVLLVIVFFDAPLLVKNLPNFWTTKRLKLGLDLQGGSQILLNVDFSELKLSDKQKQDAVKTALEIIRNRIDQFGVSEPTIQKVGANRIIVQLPGLKDPTRAKELIGKTALLEFKIVQDNDKLKDVYTKLDAYLKENIDNYPTLKEDFSDIETSEDEVKDILATDSTKTENAEDESADLYGDVFSQITTSVDNMPYAVSNKYVAIVTNLLKNKDFIRNIPAGLQIALSKENKNDPNADRQIFILNSHAELTGKYLEKASVQINQGYDPKRSGKAEISLKFDKKGAKIFEKVTAKNINKRLAIVLDGVVYVAPVIQNKIPGGNAVINGSFPMEEAQDLAIVLNAGNLPAPIKIIEERTVGPTLGSDSIKAGVMAALIGMILVVLFMLVYYKGSGLLADIAVLVNIGFIIAVLTIFKATLTMPGIAGMILTIGMAVDANVIIFERIRENIAAGKTIRSAVDSGFDRAMVTIIDANITTLITAIVLYQFGTGPIKGFAVTLSIGIIGSLFASIVLVKAMFDAFITNAQRDKLSI